MRYRHPRSSPESGATSKGPKRTGAEPLLRTAISRQKIGKSVPLRAQVAPRKSHGAICQQISNLQNDVKLSILYLVWMEVARDTG